MIMMIDLRTLDVKGLDLLTGILLAAWRFHDHRTTIPADKAVSISEIAVLCRDPQKLQEAFKRNRAIIEGVIYARALTAEPANILYPAAYATRLLELKDLGVDVEIIESEEMATLGMGGLLAIANGSCNPPRIAILKWNGGDGNPIALVGKGVCFDSGGLCLKKPEHMLCMKWDKAGAGSVAGCMKALALMNAPVNIVGVLGLIENMPGSAAAKPGDIVKTMSGQTVEIINTDAEGRLVLAECLTYVQRKYFPKVVVDLGTLTQETFASLGSQYAGLYSNDGDVARALLTAGKVSGDNLWELPMGEYFAKQIESDIADMKNLGWELNGENGAAAEFLKRFVDRPWAHIDLAGACWSMEDTPIAAKGPNGFGVRLLVEWVTQRGT